jgi:hypothetical protein
MIKMIVSSKRERTGVACDRTSEKIKETLR